MQTEKKIYEVDGLKVDERYPTGYLYGKDATRKTRIYVSADVDLEVGIRPEYTADPKEWAAYNRRVVKAWKNIVERALPGIPVRFSRTAGCSCGCSAGFVYNGPDTRFNNATDIFITEPQVTL